MSSSGIESPRELDAERLLELAVLGLQRRVERVEPAQLGLQVACRGEISAAEGLVIGLPERGLALAERARHPLHVLQGRSIVGLQLEREAVVEDRLRELATFLEIMTFQ